MPSACRGAGCHCLYVGLTMLEVAGQTGEVSSLKLPQIAARPGSSLSIIGPSASGKTRFCLALAGLDELAGASNLVRLNGRPISDMSPEERAKSISFVPSDASLSLSGIKSTVGGELELAWRLLGRSPSHAELSEHAAIFGLEGLLAQDPTSLSGGQVGRLALALATVKRPQLLILDQVVDHIDPESIKAIAHALTRMLPPKAILIETRSRCRASGMVDLFGEDSCQWQYDASTGWNIATVARTRSPDPTRIPPSHGTPVLHDRHRSDCSPSTAEPRKSVLVAEGLSFCYESSGFKLGPVDLTLHEGDRAALVGPNGSGKTTLLKCLSMLLRPTFAKFEIRSRDGQMVSPPAKDHRLHRWASFALYCFQRPEDQLYLSSVRAELTETRRRVARDQDDALALEIAEALGLGDGLDKSPFDLPRSQRRLLTIASALAAESPVLMLDEPSALLDDDQVGRLTEALEVFGSRSAILMITHDQAFLNMAATRTLLLSDLGSLTPTKGSLPAPTWCRCS
jgi:energy-coupling factor transport system ATP-binding protein